MVRTRWGRFRPSFRVSGNQVIFADWSKIKIWSYNGSLVIGTEKPKRVTAELSYGSMDNVHPLETLIRFFFKSGASRVSEAFA